MTILTFPAEKQLQVMTILQEQGIIPTLEDITLTVKTPTLSSEIIIKLKKEGVKYLTPIKL